MEKGVLRKVVFFTACSDVSVGSYRIWVRDLSTYFNKIGINTSINTEVEDGDTVILCKSLVSQVNSFREAYPRNVLGVINPEGGKRYSVDFVIAGSVEEKDSLMVNKNVFIFPLIEDQFQRIPRKEHCERGHLTIGFHGSFTHLNRFEPNLKWALEEFSKKYSFTLKVITGTSRPVWRKGKPNIRNIEFRKWSADTVSKEILSCDIGVVPNLSHLRPLMFKKSKKEGLFSTDIFMRMKNKSNAGRAFVFIQHGIPVVADITPSHIHLFGNPSCGYAVLTREGWLHSFEELVDSTKRQSVAEHAFRHFSREYDPIVWARRLVYQIEELYV